ncbi:hypothetical protein EJN92_21115 [Undibacterium parvum]|uniref:Uncharacterized protein n=1 Tax=Undibacterium parvum TaxID=401471 RepID=A0A3S9HRF5_9BURK|nr:hypothetical protein EJN92_21115 [Undibacterium parvum]
MNSIKCAICRTANLYAFAFPSSPSSYFSRASARLSTAFSSNPS